MAYTFSVRAYTKDQMLAALDAKLSEAIAALPHHAAIREQTFAVVKAFAAAVSDDPSKDYLVQVNAALAEDSAGGIFAVSIGVNVDQVDLEG